MLEPTTPTPTQPKRKPKTQRPERQGKPLALANPEPWPEPVSGEQLLGELMGSLARFIAADSTALAAMALWVLHAHTIEAAAVSPLLVLSSPEKRCGKTTALRVLHRLVPRPQTVSNMTPATLFRVVEAACPTLLIDEADTFIAASEELRGIMNSGHTRDGAEVLRTVGDDFEPRRFSTWAPKVVALIGRLPATLEDRSIVIPMRRRKPEERVEHLRLDRPHELAHLPRKAWSWGQAHLGALRSSDPALPSGLHDRAGDNWRPLLAIAQQIGPTASELACAAALALSAGESDSSAGVRVMLLGDIRRAFAARGVDRLRSAELADWLVSLEDRPWSDWRNGKAISPSQIARQLQAFKVGPKAIRFGNETPRGYELEDFADSFARYLPPEPQQPQHSAPVAAEAASEQPETPPIVAPEAQPLALLLDLPVSAVSAVAKREGA